MFVFTQLLEDSMRFRIPNTGVVRAKHCGDRYEIRFEENYGFSGGHWCGSAGRARGAADSRIWSLGRKYPVFRERHGGWIRLADPRLRIKGPPNEPPWSIGCGSRAGRTADEVEIHYEAQTKSKAAAHRPSQGIVASIIGRVSLLAGATGLLSELKSALNTIWRTREQSDVKEIVNKKICYSSLDPSLSIQMGENVLISWSSQKQPLAR
jgi:hypothetical protein